MVSGLPLGPVKPDMDELLTVQYNSGTDLAAYLNRINPTKNNKTHLQLEMFGIILLCPLWEERKSMQV